MRVFERTASAIVLDRDGVSLSQTPGAAGNLLINGAGASAGVATMNPARQVAIYSGGDLSGRTFVVYGTDRAGNAITETITGPNNTTVSTLRIFETVTQISIDAAAGAALEVGWTAVSYTSWVILGNYEGHYVPRIVGIPTGTVSYEIEVTTQNMYRDRVTGEYPDDIFVLQAAGAVRTDNVLQAPYAAVRLRQVSGTGSTKLRVLPSKTV